MKQQKLNTGDGFDLSSLTLAEPSPPLEDPLMNISTKVSLVCEDYMVLLAPAQTRFHGCMWNGPGISAPSRCCSTPLPLTTRWWRRRRSCRGFLQAFWRAFWRSPQKRRRMRLQRSSSTSRAPSARRIQAAPQPAWCMDPTTTSTKVGQSRMPAALHWSAEDNVMSSLGSLRECNCKCFDYVKCKRCYLENVNIYTVL